MFRLRFLIGAVAAAAAISCVASLDLDRFRQDGLTGTEGGTDGNALPPDSVKFLDLRFGAKGMTSHLNEQLEIRVVDKDNKVTMRALYAGVRAEDFSLFLGSSIPRDNPPYRIDWWADHNNTFKYDGIDGGINDKDHAWRRVLSEPLPEDVTLNGSLYTLAFQHDTNFKDILTNLDGVAIPNDESLLPFTLNLAGLEPYIGKTFEVREATKSQNQLVGFHRQGRVRENDVAAQIPSILDSATIYVVSLYADVNDDGRFSAPDPSWKVEIESTESGIEQRFDLSGTPQSPIDTGER